MPRRASEYAVRVNCPLCGGEYDEKSLKRHIDGHKEERGYSCEYCPKRFKQKTNRDTHTRTHNDEWLQCDACGELCKQASEMTRHKQEAHGHPRRKEEAPYSRRITHSIVNLPAVARPAAKGKACSTGVARRSKQFTIPRKHSPQLSKPSIPSSSSTALSTPTPSSFQNSIFDLACPSSSSYNLPKSFDFTHADESYLPPHLMWPTDPSNFDSQFCLTQLPRSENPCYEQQGLWEYPSFLLSAYSTEQAPLSNVEQPIFPDVTQYASPFSCEVPLPTSVSYFQSNIHNQGDAYAIEDPPSPSQLDAALTELWKSLSVDEQAAVIEAHPLFLEPASVVPAPVPLNDAPYPTYEGSENHLIQSSGTAFETSFIDFPEAEEQDISGPFNF